MLKSAHDPFFERGFQKIRSCYVGWSFRASKPAFPPFPFVAEANAPLMDVDAPYLPFSYQGFDRVRRLDRMLWTMTERLRSKVQRFVLTFNDGSGYIAVFFSQRSGRTKICYSAAILKQYDVGFRIWYDPIDGNVVGRVPGQNARTLGGWPFPEPGSVTRRTSKKKVTA